MGLTGGTSGTHGSYPRDGCQLRINVSQAEEGVVTIAVAGELDLATAPMVGDTFHKINNAQPLHVHFDLSGVNFCDASRPQHIPRRRPAPARHWWPANPHSAQPPDTPATHHHSSWTKSSPSTDPPPTSRW